MAERHNIPFADLRPAMESRSLDEVYLMRQGDLSYPVDTHLSRTGHMLAAAALADAIRKANLLPAVKTSADSLQAR